MSITTPSRRAAPFGIPAARAEVAKMAEAASRMANAPRRKPRLKVGGVLMVRSP